jgi:hypothetical protein
VLQFFPLFAAYPLIRLATARHFRLPSLRKFGDVSLRHVSLWLADRANRAGAARRSHIMVGDIRDSIARFGGARIRLLTSARKARAAIQEMAAGGHGRKQS